MRLYEILDFNRLEKNFFLKLLYYSYMDTNKIWTSDYVDTRKLHQCYDK